MKDTKLSMDNEQLIFEIKIEGFSDTQLYQAAGNGWDINLVSKIFKKWFGEHYIN